MPALWSGRFTATLDAIAFRYSESISVDARLYREDIAGSAKVFYEGLLPEQKLLADSRFATIMPLIAGTAVVGTPPATEKPRTP